MLHGHAGYVAGAAKVPSPFSILPLAISKILILGITGSNRNIRFFRPLMEDRRRRNERRSCGRDESGQGAEPG